MGARDGAVDASQRQLRFPLRHQMGHDLVPYPADRPTAEPQIGMVPIAKFRWDRTPFRAIVDPPDDRFDSTTVFSPRPCTTDVGRRDRRLEFRPLRARQNLHRLSTPTIKQISCAVAAASHEMRTDPRASEQNLPDGTRVADTPVQSQTSTTSGGIMDVRSPCRCTAAEVKTGW